MAHRKIPAIVAFVFFLVAGFAHSSEAAITFSDPNHQLEIGGHQVGLEFHRGRALPSRISWFAPLANSIDISQDYWTRDSSLVMTVLLDGDTLGLQTESVRWLPSEAQFELTGGGSVSYNFADQPAALLLTITPDPEWNGKTVTVSLVAQLRSSHSYKTFEPARAVADEHGVIAEFPFVDTGYSRLALACAQLEQTGSRTVRRGGVTWLEVDAVAGDSPLLFVLTSGELDQPAWIDINQAIAASQRFDEEVNAAVGRRTVSGWKDIRLEQGLYWSKAVMLANRHTIGGLQLPMPCPAQYNFFFTHDLLVTHLGTVKFDPTTVKRDLLALLAIADGSEVLPHAWYWKDDHYQVEWSGADNWNHLWFLLLSGSYRRHTADRETLEQLVPMLQASLHTVAGHISEDTLMVAGSPDWWDIGDAEGARPYLTALAARALEEGVETLRWVKAPDPESRNLLQLATGLRRNIGKLWNDSTGYLHDWLGDERDPHFYTGALVAAWLDALDPVHSETLVETAQDVLLDRNIGVRNAMPPDFHTMNDRYGFLEGEVGAPWIYFNAGVWPQGNAWLALAQAQLGRLDDALETVTRYMTPLGVAESPGGQPSFYEYRVADQSSERYGRVDKPTFLWSGGWLVHTAYRIAGLIDTPWNLALDPALPSGSDTLWLNVARPGGFTVVERIGRGECFSRLQADGEFVHSAVLIGSPEVLVAESGAPVSPYLAAANTEVLEVTGMRGGLKIALATVPGRLVKLTIDAPLPPDRVIVEGGELRSRRASLSVIGRYHLELFVNSDFPQVQVTF